MKSIAIEVKAKDGTVKRGTVIVPDTLGELVGLLGEKFIYHSAVQQYTRVTRRRLATGARPRKRILHLPVDSLTDEQRALLSSIGLLNED